MATLRFFLIALCSIFAVGLVLGEQEPTPTPAPATGIEVDRAGFKQVQFACDSGLR